MPPPWGTPAQSGAWAGGFQAPASSPGRPWPRSWHTAEAAQPGCVGVWGGKSPSQQPAPPPHGPSPQTGPAGCLLWGWRPSGARLPGVLCPWCPGRGACSSPWQRGPEGPAAHSDRAPPLPAASTGEQGGIARPTGQRVLSDPCVPGPEQGAGTTGPDVGLPSGGPPPGGRDRRAGHGRVANRFLSSSARPWEGPPGSQAGGPWDSLSGSGRGTCPSPRPQRLPPCPSCSWPARGSPGH